MGERKFTIRFDDEVREWVGVRDSSIWFCPSGLGDIWDTEQYEGIDTKLAFRVRTSPPRYDSEDWYRGYVVNKYSDYPEVYLYESGVDTLDSEGKQKDDYAFPTRAIRSVGDWLKSHGFADNNYFWVKLEEA